MTARMATAFPSGVAVRASLIAVVLAILLNAFLLFDFTRTVMGAFTFHQQGSFVQDLVTPSIVVYFLPYAIPLDDRKG